MGNYHYLTPDMKERLFSHMRNKGVKTTYLCKILNVHYCDFKSTINGKSVCYGKWQTKVANVLGMDRTELFKEFWEK